MDKTIINEIKTIMNVKTNQIKNLKRFEKGMSNYTYYFEINNDKYVIRLIGKGASKYVDYYNELNVILLLSNLDLTSQLVYFDPITGTKTAKYIDGAIYQFTSNKDLTALVETLKQLHNIKNDHITNYLLIDRINKYESFLKPNLIDKKYIELKNWWLNIYLKNYQNEPLVLCHNDLQDANIIETDKKVYLIDFEYASYNDLFYDLASFEEDAYLVYEKYFDKKIDTNNMNHIDFYKMYQSLQWYLVATYKESIGFSKETNYDFNELKAYFINRANELYLKLKKRGLNYD